MSAPSPLADKVYSALRGATKNPQHNELLLTDFALRTTDVFYHVGLLSGRMIFEPSLRYKHLLQSMQQARTACVTAHGKEQFQDYCLNLSKAYLPNAQKHLSCDPQKEITALVEPVMALYHPNLMQRRQQDHIEYLQRNMVADLATRFITSNATVSYHNQPDFNVTHLKDVIQKQPDRHACYAMEDPISKVFDDFQLGCTPHISDKTQYALASYYMIQRADFFTQTHRADQIQFKIHADTSRFALTASGPFFDAHIQSFREQGFAVTTHTPSNGQTVDKNIVWLANEKCPYYTIA